MPAAIVGDITPHDGVSDEEKFSLEAAAIQKMRDTLGSNVLAGQIKFMLRKCTSSCTISMVKGSENTTEIDHFAGEEIEQLWHEYEQGQTPAAQLVKDFDKVTRAAYSNRFCM